MHSASLDNNKQKTKTTHTQKNKNTQKKMLKREKERPTCRRGWRCCQGRRSAGRARTPARGPSSPGGSPPAPSPGRPARRTPGRSAPAGDTHHTQVKNTVHNGFFGQVRLDQVRIYVLFSHKDFLRTPPIFFTPKIRIPLQAHQQIQFIPMGYLYRKYKLGKG